MAHLDGNRREVAGARGRLDVTAGLDPVWRVEPRVEGGRKRGASAHALSSPGAGDQERVLLRACTRMDDPSFALAVCSTAKGSRPGAGERPALRDAMDHLRAGDTLVVWRPDRLGRSLRT